MSLTATMKRMHAMLTGLAKDLMKAEKGNKAASQRVRTGSIKFSKLAKCYRKDSVKSAKKAGKKKPVKKTAKGKAPARKTVKKKTASKKSTRKNAPARKTTARRKTTKRKTTRRR